MCVKLPGAVRVTKIHVKRLVIFRPSWDFQTRDCSENNLRDITSLSLFVCVEGMARIAGTYPGFCSITVLVTEDISTPPPGYDASPL